MNAASASWDPISGDSARREAGERLARKHGQVAQLQDVTYKRAEGLA